MSTVQKKLIVANWKMNPTSQKEALAIFTSITKTAAKLLKVQCVVCPPFVYLSPLAKALTGHRTQLGAQNVFPEIDGAYTGEISPKMLRDLKANYVILGHSEVRRQGETNENINLKIKAALKVGLIPVLCIGEKERDDAGFYHAVVKEQLEIACQGISKAGIAQIVIAYEPVWAIGKDAQREATPAESLEMSIYIRKVLSDLYDSKTAQAMQILYGGSVNPKNAGYFLQDGGVQGLLVGRDSLNPKKFEAILKEAERLSSLPLALIKNIK